MTLAFSFSNSLTTLISIQTFPIGLKYVDNDLDKTIAAGIPTMDINNKQIWIIVIIADTIPKGIEEADKKKNKGSLGTNLMKTGCSIMVLQLAVVWLIVIGIIVYVLYTA